MADSGGRRYSSHHLWGNRQTGGFFGCRARRGIYGCNGKPCGILGKQRGVLINFPTQEELKAIIGVER